MSYPPISFVRGGYVSDMNRLGFKEGGEVSKEEPPTTSVKDEWLKTPSDIGDAWSKRLEGMDTARRAREAGDINLATSTWETAGDIAGGIWDTGAEILEPIIDTAQLGAKTIFPETYEATAEAFNDAGEWVLDTKIGRKGAETVKDIYEWYQEFKEENPHGAKSLEAAGNILPLALTGKVLKTQMDTLKKTTTPTSTYKYKPNSDTPHINVRDTVQYQGLKDITTDKLNKVNKFFNPDVINKALNSTDINTKVIYMTPGEFLTLAKTHTSNIETKKLDRINTAINKGVQLEDIPTLTIQSGKAGGSQVIKHDGRHRANALYDLGEELIPVRVVIKGNKDNKRIFTVTNEDGLEVYTFPNNVVYNRRHLGEAGTLKKENTKATMPAKKTQDPTITQKITPQKSLVSRLPKKQKGYNLDKDNHDGTWSQGTEHLDGSTSYNVSKIPYKYEVKYRDGTGKPYELYNVGFDRKTKQYSILKVRGDKQQVVSVPMAEFNSILNNTHPGLEQVKRTMKY